MTRLFSILAVLFGLAPAVYGQAVIVPSPVPALTNNCTLKWQTATSTWVCSEAGAASQPLTDSIGLIADDEDATKILALQVSAITHATTRIWIIPDANLTVPSTIASLGENTFTGLQTLNGGLAATTGTFSSTLSVTGGITGTLATAAQPNITSLGTIIAAGNVALLNGANTFTGLQTLNGGLAATTGTFSSTLSVTGEVHGYSAPALGTATYPFGSLYLSGTATLPNPKLFGSGVDGTLGITATLASASYPTIYLNKIQSSISSTPANSQVVFALSTGTITTADVLAMNGAGKVTVGGSTFGEALRVIGLNGSSAGVPVRVTASNDFWYDSSSVRNKLNVAPFNPSLLSDDRLSAKDERGGPHVAQFKPHPWAALLKLDPVIFTDKAVGTEEIGFLAEDVDALGLSHLVFYEPDGVTPRSLLYDRMVIYLQQIVKDHEARLAALESGRIR